MTTLSGLKVLPQQLTYTGIIESMTMQPYQFVLCLLLCVQADYLFEILE